MDGRRLMRPGTVLLDFAGEERVFRLGVGQLRALQDKTHAGPLKVLERLQDGAWRVDDIRETVYLGLIGGGMKMPEASKLLRRAVDDFEVALFDLVPIARALILAALTASKDAMKAAEADAAPGETEAATGSIPSPPSSETSARSDTRRLQ